MIELTKQETIEALKKLFDYERNKENQNVMVIEHKDKTTFMINKQYKERFEVIKRLQDFFVDKVITGGQCRIDNITFVYTVFYIEDRNK